MSTPVTPPNGAPSTPPPQPTATAAPPASSAPAQPEGLSEGQQRALLIGATVVGILILALVIWATYFLVTNPAHASVWRDVFIIFMAVEALFIGVALLVLMVQLAVLTNVLKNEIKPILEATQETVNTVRGTTVFVSENLTEPILKLNSYVAGLSKIVESLSAFGSLFRRN
jgi:hypothetical protein